MNEIEKKYRPYILIVSIVVPVVVALLFAIKIEGYDFTFLPPIYASLNALTAILLVSAVIAIKKQNRLLHQRLIKIAILCSLLFLVGYILYHITSETTIYGDINGNHILEPEESATFKRSKFLYLIILLTHIVLSVVVIPLVLITYVKGIASNFTSHKKWAKITFPIWLYVAVSGVVVYLMISPFY